MAFELNPQQLNAVKEGVKWFKSGYSKQTYEISGPAGSGKTTIVKDIEHALGIAPEDVLYIAYVGKAAQNLALKGHNARTIHSALYNMINVPKTDIYGNFIMKNGRNVTYRSFIKREMLPKNIKLIVVDEGGMVDIHMRQDILSFGLPIIVLGDLNQLPPVFGRPGFLIEPDIILTEIMRQAEDSEIIWMSQQILNGKPIPYGKYNNSLVLRYDEAQDQHLMESDMIICGTNRTRDNINNYMRREIYKYDDKYPLAIGEKVVCRKNDWTRSIGPNNDVFLINGMVGYIENIHLNTFNGKTLDVDFRPDFMQNDMFRNLKIDIGYLMTPSYEEYNSLNHSLARLQRGNAISVHLSQGSQYPSVYYHRDYSNRKKYQRALDYTAITRAEQRIILVQ